LNSSTKSPDGHGLRRDVPQQWFMFWSLNIEIWDLFGIWSLRFEILSRLTQYFEAHRQMLNPKKNII
jgi:hypothetical protein